MLFDKSEVAHAHAKKTPVVMSRIFELIWTFFIVILFEFDFVDSALGLFVF